MSGKIITNFIIRARSRGYMTSLVLSKRPILFSRSLVTLDSHLSSSPLFHNSRISSSINYELIQKRYKKKAHPLNQKGGGKVKDEVEEEEEEEEEIEENPLLVDDLPGDDDTIDMIVSVSSIRLDNVAKSVFRTNRGRIEEAYHKGELLLNGKLPNRKSIDVSVEDEIDLVKYIDPDDRTKLVVKRALVTEIPHKADNMGRLKIHVKCWDDVKVEKEKQDE